MDDIMRLRQIAALLDEGLNLAGIAMVLRLEADNARLRREISDERDRRRHR
jgi:DNA-binding transcriptional MerR regulator